MTLKYVILTVSQKMGCWVFFSVLLLHKNPFNTIVFSLRRLKTYLEALKPNPVRIRILQGLTARLTVPKPLSWRSDFISWRHRQPFTSFLGLIPLRDHFKHAVCLSSLQPLFGLVTIHGIGKRSSKPFSFRDVLTLRKVNVGDVIIDVNVVAFHLSQWLRLNATRTDENICLSLAVLPGAAEFLTSYHLPI